MAKRLSGVICESCGEHYSLRNFSKDNPLEVCGECGCESFLPYSSDCLKGYRSLEHYTGLLDLLPMRLRSALPSELYPRIFPFIKTE